MSALNQVWFNVTAYCGKDEFDIWKPSNLHFGLCFQKTYFAVPSSALLAVTSAYYLGKQSEWVVRTKFQAATILIRTLLCALTLCLTLLEPLLVYFYAHGTVYWVDALDVGVQCVSWLVHLGYLGTLKHRLGKGTRGMAPVILSWLTGFVVLINCTRTYWYRSDGPSPLIENITRWCTLTQLILQILYLFTLFPKGHAGRSQYQTLSREPNERTPLIETSYSDYSRFHEAADPYHLGIAEDGVNFLSYLTFHWVNGLMEKGSLGLLKTQDDLHDLPLLLRTDVIAHKVSKSILLSQPLPGEDEGGGGDEVEFRGRRPKKFSLLKILHKCFGWQFYSIGILKLIGDGLGFAGPLLLHQLVTFIQAKDEQVWKGYSYVGGLCAAALCATFCSIHFNYLMSKVNIRVRAALISTVYRKVLTVSSSNLGSFTTGEVINMMSTDTDRVVNFCSSFHAFWSLPLQLAVTLYLLYNEIGIAFLAGVAIAVILIPINRWLAIKIGKLSVEMMWYKDRRVGLMTEVISMIRMVKLNAWESTFKDRIMDERYGEVKALAGRKYLDAACVFFWATTPVLIPIVTFTTYIALGNSLDPARVFTAIALFNMLIMPLNAFPWVINGLVEAFVSLRRIQKLMELPEQELNSYYTVVEEMNHRDSDLQVLITNGTFSWNANMISQSEEDTQQNSDVSRRLSSEGSSISHSLTGIDEDMVLPTLRRIDMQLNKGQVVAIVGRVGSGKSSLINSILAEMEKVHGVIAVSALHRGFGYASQQPWIQNGTIKDNILFGNSLDTQRYRSVLYSCALDEDLRGFPLRDETPCGENGSSLSGGQKSRVALARAVYQNKSIYILDDVLSAVDAPVARHIMRHCVHGLLAGRTVLIVSNALKLLTKVNWLILCDNGVIKEQGPASVVLPKLVDDLSDDWWDEAENNESSDDLRSQRPPFDVFSSTSVDSYTTPPAELESEEREFGSLSSSVFHTCFTAVGAFVSISIFGSMILMQTTRNLTDMWLAYWVSHTSSQNSTGTTVMLNAAPALWFSTSSIIDHASHLQRDPLMDHQGFMAPLKPFAQVLASQDIPKINENLAFIDPQTKFYLIVYSVLAGSNTIFSLFRAFLFAYGGICAARNIHRRLLDAVLYAKITFFDMNPLGRILNRFSSDQYTVDDSLPFQMNIFLSQIFGLLGSVFVTVYGLPWILLLYIPLVFVYYTIQLYYRHTSRDLKRLHALSLSPLYAHFTETLKGLPVIRAMRAVHRFSVRGDSLLEVSQRAQFDIQAASQWLNLRLQLIGVAMLAGVSLLSLIQHHFLAIEPGLVGLVISYALTISGYLNNVVGSLTETERELVSIERVNQYIEGAEGEKKEGVGAPPYAWPSHGAIRFQGVFLRYQSHNPYALRNVSLEIGASEKVGIIGRTGAGKSSLFMALFRLLEVSRGRIYIDNIDISKLSLKKLRSNMAIVSQDAFLFSGTIRENLDPRGESLDTQIWQAIHSCYLGNLVQATGGLDARIEESGRTFSAGQRQLFCLARAMLSRTKIVCIDEGTSRLDNETDEQIQQTIRSAFRNKTVLIIAHRVHTIRDCDRILVLSEGEVVESGRPGELLSNKTSHFYNIVHSQ